MTEQTGAGMQLEKLKLIHEDFEDNCLNSPVDRIFLAIQDFFCEELLETEADSMTKIKWLTKKNF